LGIILGLVDLDVALQSVKPATLTKDSTNDEKLDMSRWKRSNRMCLQVMQKIKPEAFRGAVSETIIAKEFLTNIEQKFVKNEKTEMGNLLKKFCSKLYSGQGNIREYILEMTHMISKLRTIKLDMLVIMILNSLPPKFEHFLVSYNCQKKKWTVNELISHCVQEEERLKNEPVESVNVDTSSKNKGKKKRKTMDKDKDEGQKK
jgi:gag-polypeptide of LTR copia-type